MGDTDTTDSSMERGPLMLSLLRIRIRRCSLRILHWSGPHHPGTGCLYPGIRSLCSLWIRTPRTPLWSLPGISLTGELFRLLRFYLLDTLRQIIQCRAECSRTLMDV